MDLFRRIIRYFFSSVFLGVITVIGVPFVVVLTVLAGLIFLPLPATIPIPKANAAQVPTTIYDRYGNVIATLQQYDQNVPVSEASIPTILKEAVISDEDRNFYKQGGVDIRGTVRAAIADVRNDKVVQGGSTITQQYVKLAFTGGQRNIFRKVREAILASQLDRQASKDEILYRYLTTVYFGDGNYGIGAAAKNYFHETVAQLTPSQSALLAGLIPAPSQRAPFSSNGTPQVTAAESDRELVLQEMEQQGYLSPAQYEKAYAAKVSAFSATSPPGSTLVFPPATSATSDPDFTSYVTSWLLQHYPASEVYGGGLRVQTTLDPKIEADAKSSVAATLAGTGDPLEMGLASVEPQTGFVQALVGGRAFGNAAGSPKFYADNFSLGGCTKPPQDVVVTATCDSGNTITGGGAGRQPGSAWKPFVLATAFEQGIPPSKEYSAPDALDIPGCKTANGDACEIHNDEDGSYGGSQTLAYAMAQSTNTVYAQLAPQVGCANVARTAKALGITSAYYAPSMFPYCQTYALGVIDVSPLDMASAYGVFDNHGLRATPTPVLEIVNPTGKVLVDNLSTPPATTRVLPANVADNVTNVLTGVISGGTATSAQMGRPAAGKTGTTSNYTNAWFCGYTPTLSTAVWMGRANSESQSIGDVKGVDPVYGGTWPAITWKNYMTQALASVPATPFSQPAPITPPAPAKVLAPTSTTVAPLAPGDRTYPTQTPTGGPYVQNTPSGSSSSGSYSGYYGDTTTTDPNSFSDNSSGGSFSGDSGNGNSGNGGNNG